jgi:hypothetical protein
VLAAVTAVINSKLPAIGLLLLIRLAVALNREMRRNNRTRCEPLLRLLAQLVNQVGLEKQHALLLPCLFCCCFLILCVWLLF